MGSPLAWIFSILFLIAVFGELTFLDKSSSLTTSLATFQIRVACSDRPGESLDLKPGLGVLILAGQGPSPTC